MITEKIDFRLLERAGVVKFPQPVAIAAPAPSKRPGIPMNQVSPDLAAIAKRLDAAKVSRGELSYWALCHGVSNYDARLAYRLLRKMRVAS